MIASKKSNLLVSLGSFRFFSAVIIAIVLFAFAGVSWVYIQPHVTASEGASGMQAVAPMRNPLYLIVRRANRLNSVLESSVLVVDPTSGKVIKSFDAGYNAVAKLTTDKRILYIFNQPLTGNEGALSAIDPLTGAVLWKAILPGWPAVGLPTDGIWLSSDEKLLYLQATVGGLTLHIFAMNAATGAFVHDFVLQTPYATNVAFPRTWKLPWAEMLVVVPRDQLFTFDLASGKSGNSINLVDPPSVQHIPRNFPKGYYVQDGAIDPDTHKLILATAPQEIVSVDLNQQSFTSKRVFSLPAGWLFGGGSLVLANSKEKALYVQVKHTDTPVLNGTEAEQVWTLDTTTWTQKSQLSLRDQLAKFTNSSVSNVDLRNYGLFLSNDGQSVYALASSGFIRMNHDASGNLNGNWLDLGAQLQSLSWYGIVQ